MGDITKLLRMSSMHEHIHQKDLKVNEMMMWHILINTGYSEYKSL